MGEGRKEDHQTERLLRKFKEEGRYTNTRTHTCTHTHLQLFLELSTFLFQLHQLGVEDGRLGRSRGNGEPVLMRQ